jgi:imidazolonepropionase-like amidohydrolase
MKERAMRDLRTLLRKASLCGLALLLSTQAPAQTSSGTRPPSVLFRNVTVITMTQEGADPRQDVLVTNGTIARIGATGSVQAPAGAVTIDGAGRYLMPGLAEMHAHLPPKAQEQNAKDILLLYVAHGITTIRGMLGDPWHLELRDQIARHEVLGPRLYTAGPSFNGNTVPTVESAQTKVREQAAAGYNFLKLHPGLKRNVFDAIVATSGEVKITFQGHVSDDVGVPHALQKKQRAIDHLDGYVRAVADEACAQKVQSPGIFGMGFASCAQPSRITAIAQQTKEAGTWMVPTQVLLEQWALPPTEDALKARPALRFVPPNTLTQWQTQLRNIAGPEGVPPEQGRRYVEVTRSLIREMHARGVPIIVGSDAPQVYNVPGDSALEELAVYAQIGLSPLEVLRTATTNPARFFDASNRFGAVREGMDADLILVDSNPLSDVKALRKLSGVMVRGQWLARSDLDAKLNELVARVNPSRVARIDE